MELKDNLRELRTASGLTQEALANQIFVSRTLISKWESGERYPSKDNLARLAVFFRVSQEELIGGKKENEKYNKYNAISLLYSFVCGAVSLGLIILMILAVIERFTLGDGWTGMGGYIISVVFVLPVIFVLVLLETLMLKKKNGYKTLELYAVFSLILVWLISIPVYLFMI